MAGTTVDVKTADGVAKSEYFEPTGPAAGGKRPGVLMYMDVFGE